MSSRVSESRNGVEKKMPQGACGSLVVRAGTAGQARPLLLGNEECPHFNGTAGIPKSDNCSR
jgi:hypothetical protein